MSIRSLYQAEQLALETGKLCGLNPEQLHNLKARGNQSLGQYLLNAVHRIGILSGVESQWVKGSINMKPEQAAVLGETIFADFQAATKTGKLKALHSMEQGREVTDYIGGKGKRHSDGSLSLAHEALGPFRQPARHVRGLMCYGKDSDGNPDYSRRYVQSTRVVDGVPQNYLKAI